MTLPRLVGGSKIKINKKVLGKKSVKIASRHIYYLTYIFQKSYSYDICGLIKLSYCYIFLLMQQRIKAQNSAPRVLIVFPSAVHFLYLLPSQHRSQGKTKSNIPILFKWKLLYSHLFLI